VADTASDLQQNRATDEDGRIVRYALQSVARSWLWSPSDGLKGRWHRLAGCHRWAGWSRDSEGKPKRRERIELLHDPAKLRAYYGGIQSCGSSTADPVCSGVIYDYRRTEVAAALTWAREQGHRVLFITLTASHGPEMALEPFLEALTSAMRLVYKGRPWVRFKDSCGYLGSIKGTEVTYGAHGWHPHFHLLWFCEQGRVQDVRAYVDEAWSSALARVGLSGLRGIRAVVKDSSMTAAEYIAKFDHIRAWDLDAELTMWTRKNGTKQKGLTPWDFLRLGLIGTEGDAIVERARLLFREYAAALWGKHPLQFSSGLKALVGLVDVSEDDIAAGEANSQPLNVLAYIPVSEFRRIVANDIRGELLAIAGRGDVGAVIAFLASMSIRVDLPAV